MTKKRVDVGIVGLGAYLPEKVLTNEDLEKMVDTSDQWIVERTGIKTRRIATDDQAASDLAVEAAKQAIRESGLNADDIELIILATITQDMNCPSTACVVQKKLEAFNSACFDINAACSGWLYGLDVAWQYVETGRCKNALVIGTEKLTAVTDWKDRNTCVLFGDGAGAAVVAATSNGSRFLSSYLGADGRRGNLLYLPGGGSRYPATHETVNERLHYLKMEGKEVFKQAVVAMTRAAEIALERAGMKREEIACFVPHQANMRIIRAVAKKLGVPFEKFYVAVDHCGNISAASIPVALQEAVSKGVVKAGDNALLVAFGGGFTWGAMVVRM
jgi:3-oxoacyl-[acyl-carrier-protein] synthase-3